MSLISLNVLTARNIYNIQKKLIEQAENEVGP